MLFMIRVSCGVLFFVANPSCSSHLLIRRENEGLLNLSVVLSDMTIREWVPSNLLYKPGLFQK